MITKEEQSYLEFENIEKALNSYLDAARTGNAKGMKIDWLDSSRIVGSINGQNINVVRDEAITAIESMELSPEVKSKFSFIDIQGNAAAVKIDSVNWSGYRFTDYFLLSKIDGTWKVCSKVFDAHEKR